MRHAYLATASAALICATALARATPLGQQLHHAAPAEALKVDGLGNMHWDADAIDEAAQNVLKPIGRPDFSKLDVASIAKAAEPIEALLTEALHDSEHKFGQGLEWLHDVVDHGREAVTDGAHRAKEALDKATHRAGQKLNGVEGWLHKGLVEKGGVHFEQLIHPNFPKYALRVAKDPLTSCDPDVKSFSGYLDIDDDKHLWFAFFESRGNPSKDPVMMWLNGGPGCSSTTGWLFEGIGPCVVANNGTSTAYNKKSWTEHASVFFLDQPVNVGYSHSPNNVFDTPAAAEDVYAFLQLFFARFPDYSKLPFHLAAESYGGRYAPLFGAKINEENKKLAARRYVNTHGLAPKQIQLESIMLGNGLTDPLVQFPAAYDFQCNGPSHIFEPDSPECVKMASSAKTCSSLISSCYKYDSKFTCLPAGLYCWSGLYSAAQQSGLNLYDVRRSCNRDEDKDGPLCYKQLQDVETLLNQPEVKKAFNVPADINFVGCNMDVNKGFLFQGDGTHNSAAKVAELLADGVRVLVYAGDKDLMCSAIGNERWVLALETQYQKSMQKAGKKEWIVGGRKAGYIRDGEGKFVYAQVKDAGHMVPLDQPDAASALVKAWINNKSIA